MAASTAHAKLREYRKKRDFGITPEPSGAKKPKRAPRPGCQFVVQKHAARALHYDFRLELDGVLLSWSVPKGPSFDPKTRRLAMRTEDHPLDYADFEGIIPKGEYGGGTVIVWDHGSWEPIGDARAGLKKGHIEFTLDGDKLQGRWHLIRTRPQRDREAWLLIKGDDDVADPERDIVEEAPLSVVTKRSIEQVAKEKDRVWRSNRKEDGTKAPDMFGLLRSLPLSFKLTNLDKVLYPEQNLTKGAYLAYLAVVRDWILPHLSGRPLTLVRCPEGRHKHCFFQKHAGLGTPASIKRIAIAGEDQDYLMVEDLDGLLAAAQLGALELHTWGSHYGSKGAKVEKPDVLVFDLDPDPSVGWDTVVETALAMRKHLSHLGLESLVKTTGGKGLHVVVPIAPRMEWDDAKEFTRRLVVGMERAAPTRFTTNISKAKRRGRIFLDYLRNGRGATFIAPYSVRARENATVATPITWKELEAGVDPRAFTVLTVPQRLAKMKKDPWEEYDEIAKQVISAAAKKKI